jgi:hypothetical protein
MRLHGNAALSWQGRRRLAIHKTYLHGFERAAAQGADPREAGGRDEHPDRVDRPYTGSAVRVVCETAADDQSVTIWVTPSEAQG